MRLADPSRRTPRNSAGPREGIFVYYPRASRSQPKLLAFVGLCAGATGAAPLS